jgi:hypothetical protein
MAEISEESLKKDFSHVWKSAPTAGVFKPSSWLIHHIRGHDVQEIVVGMLEQARLVQWGFAAMGDVIVFLHNVMVVTDFHLFPWACSM